METSVALKLAQVSDNELVVSNALLHLANESAGDPTVAQECLKIAKPLLAHKSRMNAHQKTLVRLFGSCTCFDGEIDCLVENEVIKVLLDGVRSDDEKIVHFAVLGLGNLCCDSRTAREQVFQSAAMDDLLALEPRSDNLLALLANLSVDHQNENLAMCVLDHAAFNSSAAFALANCAMGKCVRVRKELVDEMLQSTDQAIQESGLDIVSFSSVSGIGPTPALCWMSEHVNMDVKRKARKQVKRFVEADLLAIIERGCVPVLWQLSLAEQDIKNQKTNNNNNKESARAGGFASNALDSLRERISPTVHQLLLRTLRMDGNEQMRGHVATALAHLAPQVIADPDTLDSVVDMIETEQGRPAALDFFQAIHARLVLGYEDSANQPSLADQEEFFDFDENTSPEIVCNILLSHESSKRRRDHAFSILLDRFDEMYTAKTKRLVNRALNKICTICLNQ